MNSCGDARKRTRARARDRARARSSRDRPTGTRRKRDRKIEATESIERTRKRVVRWGGTFYRNNEEEYVCPMRHKGQVCVHIGVHVCIYGWGEGGGGWDRERAATESTMMRLGTFFRRERLASLERGRKDQRKIIR